MASFPMIGGALQKLKTTSSTLLSFMDSSLSAEDVFTSDINGDEWSCFRRSNDDKSVFVFSHKWKQLSCSVLISVKTFA